MKKNSEQSKPDFLIEIWFVSVQVIGHQVFLKPLISVGEAKEKEKQEHITEAEKGEINSVLGRSVSYCLSLLSVTKDYAQLSKLSIKKI